MNELERSLQKIKNALRGMPYNWDGKRSVLELKEANYHWRQMEWVGFYFQFLCQKFLNGILKFPGPRYGNVSFDGMLVIPWDFKAHVINSNSNRVILNDSQAIAMAIYEYGSLGVILALGNANYNDQERTFQKWWENLKGGPSIYTIERQKRGSWSRLRKTHYLLCKILFLKITDETLIKCGSFQENFRNSNGSPRRKKVLMDLNNIDEEVVDKIIFPVEEK